MTAATRVTSNGQPMLLIDSQAICAPNGVSTLRENRFQLLQLIAGRRPGQCRKVELFEDVLVRGARLEQPRETTIGRAQTLHVARSGKYVECLAQIRLGVALRYRSSIGASVQFQES
jgi:hypothetical protein